MIKLFNEINTKKKEKLEKGIGSFTKEECDAFSKKYDEIVALGREENKATEHEFAKKREATFLTRLENYKDNHLLFMYDFDVDWSNNISERDLRKAKRHTAVTGGFRSDNGMEYYCNALSVVESMKKAKINLWKGIKWILANKGDVFSAEELMSA